MQTLRDKLLKAGLVTEDQVKKVQEAPAKSERPGRPERASSERGDASRGDRSYGRGAGRPASSRPPPSTPRTGSGPLITARPQPLRSGASDVDSRIPKLPPLPGSKAHQRLESLKQVELDRQLRELVLQHEVPVDVGATVFYFVTRKGKLRRLTLTQAQAEKLEKGELAVVERPDPGSIEHSLVPPEAAVQIQALSTKAVRFFNRPGAPVGFLTDDDIKDRQAKEAAGEPDVPDTEAPAAAASSSSDSEPEDGASSSEAPKASDQ